MWSTEEKERIWALAKTIYINEFLWKGKIPEDIQKIVSDMDRRNHDGINEIYMKGIYELYQKDYNPIRKMIIDLYASDRDLQVAAKMFNIEISDVLDYVYDFLSRCWDNYFQELHERYIGTKNNSVSQSGRRIV